MKIYVELESEIEELYPVLKFMYDNRNLSEPATDARGSPASVTTEPAPARKRRTKAEMAADLAAAQVATAPPVAQTTAVQEPDFDDTPGETDEFDTPPAPPAAVAKTKDDVRAALVGYQDRLAATGKDIETARAAVMALLKKVGGADKLGALTEDKFSAVIKAAEAAK